MITGALLSARLPRLSARETTPVPVARDARHDGSFRPRPLLFSMAAITPRAYRILTSAFRRASRAPHVARQRGGRSRLMPMVLFITAVASTKRLIPRITPHMLMQFQYQRAWPAGASPHSAISFKKFSQATDAAGRWSRRRRPDGASRQQRRHSVLLATKTRTRRRQLSRRALLRHAPTP